MITKRKRNRKRDGLLSLATTIERFIRVKRHAYKKYPGNMMVKTRIKQSQNGLLEMKNI